MAKKKKMLYGVIFFVLFVCFKPLLGITECLYILSLGACVCVSVTKTNKQNQGF